MTSCLTSGGWKRFLLLSGLLCAFLALRPLAAGAQTTSAERAAADGVDNESCLICHGDPTGDKPIDPEKFNRSIHKNRLCVSCHRDITETPHAVPLKPVSCKTCHPIESEIYLKSDHGEALKHGVTEAATCRSCHGDPHELLNSRDLQSPVNRSNIPQTCAQCHSQTAEMDKYDLNQDQPIDTYMQSVHGLAFSQGVGTVAVCTDCHGSHDLHRATNPDSKLHWQQIPVTCGKCHENVLQTYRRSIHGRAVDSGNRDAPVCTDCHGEHRIDAIQKATSTVYPAHISETCGQCHAAERVVTKYRLPRFVVETYMGSFHGLNVQMGSLLAANCASCHGIHDILPQSDPRSSVHPDNLQKTCGKCHPGIGDLVTRGQIHMGTRPGLEHKITGLVRKFYIIVIVSIISIMLVHNCLDFITKLKIHYRAASGTPGERMNRNERIQHAVLAFSFILLAYTGFALKYPQSWWATPFMHRGDWRSLGHRVGAALFCVLAVYHIYYILFTQSGRKHLRALRPRRLDCMQFLQSFQYYLGLRKSKPVFGFYGYIEKVEYWALVWGSLIMIMTGVLMLKETWFMILFPKWLYDVVMAVHFYEAILACLAIVLWHGYFVMFDPDEFPMKWTWISGKPSHADTERAAGEEDKAKE